MHETLIRVFYPLDRGVIVLRTEEDWQRDLEPDYINHEEHLYQFRLKVHHQTHLHYKPCIRDGDSTIWSMGANKVALLHKDRPHDVYPYFFSPEGGAISEVIEIPSDSFSCSRLLRLYLPEGYDENTTKHYPVIYMHDGRNLFFPQEAFLEQDWHIEASLDLLNQMNLLEQVIIVGIYAGDREDEYTDPGYRKYGHCLTREILPWVDASFRTLKGPWQRCVMGSSLGGVVSFYLAWEYPEIFGTTACLSSTFSFRDNLIKRVEHDSIDRRSHLRFYLDSGWPGDNYEATLKMASILLDRGFKWGDNFVHLAFPHARHSEHDWAGRMHIPLQLFFGRIRRAYMHWINPDFELQQSEIEGEEVEV
jgi:predicted alpha/beta superfamily hydrolase